MNKLKNLRVESFTLSRNASRPLIISVLMLLFVPNLTKQKRFGYWKCCGGQGGESRLSS